VEPDTDDVYEAVHDSSLLVYVFFQVALCQVLYH